MPIEMIPAGTLPAVTSAGAKSAASGHSAGASFAESLRGLLSAVDTSDNAANVAVSDMVAGTGDVHTAMIALQKAEMSLQLTMQVKNKLMTVYQDVMRMSI